MKENPFLSDLFTTTWLKHFNKKTTPFKADFLNGLIFIKHTFLPFFYNVGRNNTKGISYSFDPSSIAGFRKRAFLIYDVPEYFQVDNAELPTGLGLKKSYQYSGYLIDLTAYTSLADFMKLHFSKSSRYKYNKYFKRLHASFTITREVLYGNVTTEHYEDIFGNFKSLLEKRFEEKGITNNNLDQKEWHFFHDVTLPMIRDKKACLVVVYDDGLPIGMTLNYIGAGILFDAITVFDTDYSKFNLGYTNIMLLIDWAISNGFKTLDFSKGDFEYKKHWCTHSYAFDYHILFDRKNLMSKISAHCLVFCFDLKQKLRAKKVNEKWHRLTYKLKSAQSDQGKRMNKSAEELTTMPDVSTLELIENGSSNYSQLKREILSFAYLSGDHISDISVYRVRRTSNYIVKGKTKMVRLGSNGASSTTDKR